MHFSLKVYMPLKIQLANGLGVLSSWSQHMSSMVTAQSKGRKIDIDSIEEKMGLPDKPRKPLTPYLMFMMERKTSILQDNPGTGAIPLSRIVSNEWKNLDRTKYVKSYETAQNEYKNKLDEYNKSLSKEQKDYIKLRSDLQRQHNAFKELKKACPLPKQPIHKSSMYTSHCLAQPEYKEKMKNTPMSKIFKEVHEKYRQLSDEEKEKFIQMAEHDRMRYEKELDEWYEKIRNDPSIRKSVREQADAYYSNFKSRKL